MSYTEQYTLKRVAKIVKIAMKDIEAQHSAFFSKTALDEIIGFMCGNYELDEKGSLEILEIALKEARQHAKVIGHKQDDIFTPVTTEHKISAIADFVSGSDFNEETPSQVKKAIEAIMDVETIGNVKSDKEVIEVLMGIASDVIY